MSRRPSRRGFSLPELVVYAVLLGMLTSGLHLAFLTGSRHLARTAAASETVQDSLVAPRLLAQELGESAAAAVQGFDGQGGSVPGVVFVSPRDADGSFQIDLANGRPRWMKHVGWWLEADPRDPGALRLVRAESPLPAPQAVPPAPTMSTLDFKNGVAPRTVFASGLQGGDFRVRSVADAGCVVKYQVILTVRRAATLMTTAMLSTPRN